MVKIIILTLCGYLPMALASNISIIIDDLGNHQRDLAALNLDSRITFAILPSSPYATTLAEQAQQQGRTVMLHLPMTGSRNELSLGKYGLSQQLDEHSFKQRVLQAIHDYPSASGLNNHMGSQLTQDSQSMHWLMQVLQQQGFFFIDSRTHIASIAEATAIQYHVPNTRRHVFLDHVAQRQAIEFQWQRALKLAEQQGNVVVIAHPKALSLDFLLTLNLPQHITLIPITQQLYHPELK